MSMGNLHITYTVCQLCDVQMTGRQTDKLNPWSSLSSEAKATQSSRSYPPFTEPKGSLLCPQEPTTGPYPKPDEPTPHPTTLFI
jgi:hypothetical protein